MGLTERQRVLCLNLHNAMMMLVTDAGLEAARNAAGDSDESVKLLHVLRIIAAHLNGQSEYVAAKHASDLQALLWHGELCRAREFADELLAGFRTDPEHAADVADLTAHSVPHGLAQRIFVVLLIARDELGAEAQRMEAASPALAEVMVPQRQAYAQMKTFRPEATK
jgi:hypothetical protein